jgi:hypothetical protein
MPEAVAVVVMAAVAVAAAINAAGAAEKGRLFDLSQQGFLDSFQCAPGISLESLEKTVFPFASRRGLEYRWLRVTEGLVCFHDCLFLQRP